MKRRSVLGILISVPFIAQGIAKTPTKTDLSNDGKLYVNYNIPTQLYYTDDNGKDSVVDVWGAVGEYKLRESTL